MLMDGMPIADTAQEAVAPETVTLDVDPDDEEFDGDPEEFDDALECAIDILFNDTLNKVEEAAAESLGREEEDARLAEAAALEEAAEKARALTASTAEDRLAKRRERLAEAIKRADFIKQMLEKLVALLEEPDSYNRTRFVLMEWPVDDAGPGQVWIDALNSRLTNERLNASVEHFEDRQVPLLPGDKPKPAVKQLVITADTLFRRFHR